MRNGFGSIVLILALLTGGTLIGVFFLRSEQEVHAPAVSAAPSVAIEGVPEPVRVAIAATNESRARGLSGYPALAEGAGMLFFFEYPGKPPFWMKEMHFPIDIIWISSDWKIVDITEAAAPESYPKTFLPQDDAQYVLEVNAGFAKAHNLSIGRSVTFQK